MPASPPGVVNVVSNAPRDAGARGRRPDRAPGRATRQFHRILAASARSSPSIAPEHLKPVLLELGGKSPLLVLDDADVEAAVAAAAFGAFANQGQICMSTERIVVDETIADDVRRAFRRESKVALGRRPARGQRPCSGSLVDRSAAERVTALVLDAGRQGGQAAGRWQRQRHARSTRTCSTMSRPRCASIDEESFGPVATVVRAKGEDEAVRIANDTPYGLAAAVFSRDVNRAFRGGAAPRHRHLPRQWANRA